jgi:precorrin-8X/cobalt-precorrin-8 methylmutase
MDYLRDPDAIYAESFATIAREADLSAFGPATRSIAVRVIHSCGMTDVVNDLRISANFVEAARAGITHSGVILVDAEMVRHGIITRKAPANLRVLCFLNDPRTPQLAEKQRTTRSAAAVTLWRDHLKDAVVVVGNAPTALFALLEAIDSGADRPAAIVGFPVGFVGAAESKEELHRNPRGIEYATILGRRGGSAMAAAVVNALFPEDRH